MKKCNKCGIEKQLSDFFKHKNAKDGYENACKQCVKDRRRKRYSNTIYEI